MKVTRTVIINFILFNSFALSIFGNSPAQAPSSDGKAVSSLNSFEIEPSPSSVQETVILIRLAAGQFDPLTSPGLSNLTISSLNLSSYPGDGIGYYLVQFDGPITEVDKRTLEQAGADIFDYIPDFTFVVKMNHATRSVVESNNNVRWVGLYQPAYRIEPTLLQMFNSLSPEILKLVVTVFRGENVTPIAAQLENLGGTVLNVTETGSKSKITMQIEGAKIGDVALISGVRWIEPAPQWQLFNNEAASIIEARQVWNTHGLHGAGQIIAIADTGLDQGSTSPANLHNDFENGGGNSRVIQILDLVGDGPSDADGHGTHVAGSVLGNGLRSGAVPGTHTYPGSAYVGIAPEASLIFQAVADNGTGGLTGIPFDLNILFAQADNAGADLHTNSWGSPLALGRYTTESEEVDEYIWNHKDFSILFAAGNEGIDSNSNGVVDLDSISSPGTAKNCITVGASENNRLSGGRNPGGGGCYTWGSCWASDYPVNPIRDDRLSNNPNGLAAFSSRGPTNDGRVKPDLVAPGTNIASTRSSQSSAAGWGLINTYYRYLGGTSMATPLVAGAATLVRDFYQDRQGLTPSAALIKATLINSAADMSPGQYGPGSTQEISGPPRPNNASGWGRVNISNSLFPASPRVLNYVDNRTGLRTGQAALYTYTVTTPGSALAVTLTWSDYPGTAIANGGLVNDLDLRITAPGGALLTPNQATQRSNNPYLVYDNGRSVTLSASVDRVNNVEGIDISNAATGLYTITVQGYNVPQAPQPYAMVASGAGILSLLPMTTSMTSTTYLPIILASRVQLPSLANGNFEAGQNGSWIEYSEKGYDLIVNSFSPNPLGPHSGSWGVWLGGAYNEVAELSQQVSIPTGISSLSLTYWYAVSSVDSCGFDHGWFEVNGTKLKNYDLCSDNNTGGWVKASVNMNGYIGQTVTIKFHVDTDNVKNSNFFIDDVAFEGTSTTTDAEPYSAPPPKGRRLGECSAKTNSLKV